MSEEDQAQPSEGQAPPVSGSLQIDPVLIERTKEALQLPLPDIDSSWKITASARSQEKGRFFGLLKKKELSFDQIADLRKGAMMSPGNTLIEVKNLRKKFPNDSTLMMLSATCTNGMIMNSSSKKGVIEGMKNASKEAGTALMSNGISLFNADNFFAIYFNYLSRLKREQASVYKALLSEPRLESDKRKLAKFIQVTDYLLSEKTKIHAVTGHLKKKIKSSKFSTTWDHMSIRQAFKHVESGANKEDCGLATAIEMVSFTHALMVSFARVPILAPLVDQMLDMIPESSTPLYLRKRSVLMTRRVGFIKIAQNVGDRNTMAKHAVSLFKEAQTTIAKIEGQPVKQSYESEPYFNLALGAQMCMGLLHPEEQINYLKDALKGMETLVKLDMSKDHKYTESAQAHTHKITDFISTLSGGV
ncbi:MAG: hypothetical protein A2508_01205 [Candidatus Lambdaproteobacteria bacterium RIFOXYD12_FULL_49_8]|uniref:Nucleoprotein n=1 Tax=Candidatus Lambdaproteobacteria bacterium RIFOXYD2_FULL_50_16 TaxID=1817772 RepID=A0A1F6G589_9PROT|nr:MAG: hypothetical protein A2527_13400 [Candidatus Lambdaproteobacteria bacterium RIFOXYD2_FULL_50_16]OGG97986.1 MAG: hypothetical protein A2508_01205 [Candidatus Lambdaproteobacteria bacterium RIFOXYD12_FULL_49_8]